jgi:hypothetical protein
MHVVFVCFCVSVSVLRFLRPCDVPVSVFSVCWFLPSFVLLLYATSWSRSRSRSRSRDISALLFPLYTFCSCIFCFEFLHTCIHHCFYHTFPFFNCNFVYKNHFVPFIDALFLELYSLNFIVAGDCGPFDDLSMYVLTKYTVTVHSFQINGQKKTVAVHVHNKETVTVRGRNVPKAHRIPREKTDNRTICIK